MKRLLAATAALMLTASITPALANPNKADLNHDGQVTPQEIQSRKVAKLMRADSNGDGRISRAEFQVMLDRRAERHPPMKADKPQKDRFAKLDLNRDGFVTPGEAAEVIQRKFARHAANAPNGIVPQSSPAPVSPR